MASFFINRPIFAWVVALFVCLGGVLAIPFGTRTAAVEAPLKTGSAPAPQIGDVH